MVVSSCHPLAGGKKALLPGFSTGQERWVSAKALKNPDLPKVRSGRRYKE
jgi:hypothetical protein